MEDGKHVVTRDDDKVFEKTFVPDRSFWERNREAIKLSTFICFIIGAFVFALCLLTALSEGSVVLAWIFGIALVLFLCVVGVLYENTAIEVPKGHVLVYPKGRNIRVLRSGKLRGFYTMVSFVPIKAPITAKSLISPAPRPFIMYRIKRISTLDKTPTIELIAP